MMTTEVKRRAMPGRRTLTAKERKAYADRRVARPPLVRGISVGKLITITPREFGKVDVDRRYQRDRIDVRVNMLVEVLKAGGSIPDPITLVKYRFAEVGVDSDKLWLVDGQQRFFAALEAERPIQAMLYEADSLEAVREFFLAMQAVVHVAPNRQVDVSTSVCAGILRDAVTDSKHPLFNRVATNQGVRHRLAAATLIKGMMVAATGGKGGSSGIAGIQGVMARLDAEIVKHRSARERAEAFLALAATCLRDSAPYLVVVTLAKVANDKWEGGYIRMPSESACKALKKVDWQVKLPSYASRFAPVVTAEILKLWR